MTPPVLLLVFNRPETTARVFERIREARPDRLYVAADGPRADREGEVERCAEARNIATSVDWPCVVTTLFREENLGCRRAVGGAITWFFENEEEGVILEDDTVPDPSFFAFCAELLDRYRNDERVMCITGNNFQEDMDGYPHSYYFSIYNHCWGWASWRRAWACFDADLSERKFVDQIGALQFGDYVPGFSAFWDARLEAVHTRKVDSWANIWTFSCFANSGLTATPRHNLVSNIGFGPDATHTLDLNAAEANMPVVPIAIPLEHPRTVCAAAGYDAYVSRRHFGIGRVPMAPQRSLIRRAISYVRRRVFG